jgi:hypothetical protein
LALGVIGVAIGSSGCNLDNNFSDLGEKLLDPEVQGLNVPGERLLTGPHFDLSIQADDTGARFALAQNTERELTIINFSTQTQCRTGAIAQYADAITAPGQPALIPLLIGEPGGPLHVAFSDFACEQSPFEVPANAVQGEIVRGLSEGSGTAILLQTADKSLLLVDPWAQTIKQLAESLQSDPISAFGHHLWVDRGVIVISDASLEPLAYYGQGVEQFALSAEDAELAYIEAGSEPGAGGKLFVVNATNQEAPHEVASDACQVSYVTVDARRQLAYLSPCEDRRLVFQDRANAAIRVISDHVKEGPAIRNIQGESFLTYVTAEDDKAPTGTLWVVRGTASAIPIGDNARLRPSAVSPGGGLLAVLDLGSNGGRLVEWKNDATRDVAEGVVELGSLGALDDGALTFLGNFDGKTGDLMRLNPDLSTQVLAGGVPPGAAKSEAFLANFNGTTGDLMLLNRKSGAAELIGSGVARSSFGYAVQFDGIIMLSDRDAETNTTTLRLRLLKAGREYVVHDGVTETQEVSFPSPGLLYNVAVGDEAGVWFSKAL